MGKIEKEWDYKGFKCQVMIHTSLGFRCGYVGLPKSHKLYKVDYNDVYDKGYDLDVHGGLTFGSKIKDSDLWWLGYDCGHCGDGTDYDLIEDKARRDAMKRDYGSSYEPTRDLGYCIHQCESLVDQLNT